MAGPVTRVRYKPHNGFAPTKDNPYRGMAAFLLSDRVQGWANDAARKVAAFASAFTERSDGPGPHLADEYRVQEIPPVVLAREKNPRRAAQVINHNRAAAPVEFGNHGRPARRNLARAAMLVGEFRPGQRSELR